MTATTATLALVGAYFLGAIPFSFLVARLFGVDDVRRVGSGNVGASNVMRQAGKRAGALAFVLDASKGAFAALLALQLHGPDWLPPVCALVAVLGHIFPVWLGFEGGKGVATGVGAFLPLLPWATLVGLLTFAILLGLFRYVSVASMGGAVALAATAFAVHAPLPLALSILATAVVIVAKHHGNIRRLLTGQESRVGRRPPAPPAP